MPDGQQFEPVQINPPGRAFLACSCLCPADFNRPEFPQEEVDVEANMTAMIPLFIAVASYGAVLFTISARPAYSDGTVKDWAEFLAGSNKLEIRSAARVAIGALPAVQLECSQPSEAGLMRVRAIFLEDGGRLYVLTAMAPEQIWPSVEPLLTSCLYTFRPAESRGPMAEVGIEAGKEKIEHPKPSVEVPRVTEPEEPKAKLNQPPPPGPVGEPIEVAVASDPRSLDPADPMNARLRDSGVGLVPNVLKTNDIDRWALIGAGAIERVFRVPYGWRVIDDGRRTLVFETESDVQINFNLRPGSGRDIPDLFQSILADLVREQGDFQYFEFDVGGYKAIGCKDLKIDGARLNQCYLAAEHPVHKKMLLVCRVTAGAEKMNFALAAAETMLMSMQDPPPAAAATEPEWWLRALELERQDKLEEAEGAILKALNHLGAYSQVAHLYELRGDRLRSQGKSKEAREAYEKSCGWMDTMASGATSGGEGAALSQQAKEHRERLGM